MKNMSKNPLVSIIIPTYKGSRTLSRAVKSCLEQSYDNIEIIVVDNNLSSHEERGYTKYLTNHMKDKYRLVYLENNQNTNGSAARNLGVQASRGKYISFLDDDDFIDRNKTLKQVNYLINHSEFRAATCTFYKDGVLQPLRSNDDYTHEILNLSYTPHTSTLIFERQAYLSMGGWDSSYKRHQDYELLLRFFLNYKMAYIKSGKVYTMTDGVDNHISATELEITKRKLFKDFESIINNAPNPRKVYAAQYFELLSYYIRESDMRNSVRITYEALCVAQMYFLVHTYSRIISFTRRRLRI